MDQRKAHIKDLLRNSLQGNNEQITTSTDKLNKLCSQSWDTFLYDLSVIMLEGNDFTAQSGAALYLKNELGSTDRSLQTKEMKSQRWLQLDANRRNYIKNQVFEAIRLNNDVALHAAQLISAIAAIEWPHGQSLTIIEALTNLFAPNFQPSPSIRYREAALLTLAYALQSLEKPLPALEGKKMSLIIKAVFAALTNPKPAEQPIVVAALRVLATSLGFIKVPMQTDQQFRKRVVDKILEMCAPPYPGDVRKFGFECLLRLCVRYYSFFVEFSNQTLKLTGDCITKDNDTICIQQAIEVWASIAEHETNMRKARIKALEHGTPPPPNSNGYIGFASKMLVPLLFKTMARQKDQNYNNNPLAWTPSLAAANCLSLLAQSAGNSIVDKVIDIVKEHESKPQWQWRETSICAYGECLSGAQNETLSTLLSNSMDLIQQYVNDAEAPVRDTTFWVLGKVFHVHPGYLQKQSDTWLSGLVKMLIHALVDVPRVAVNAAWAIQQIATADAHLNNGYTNRMRRHYDQLLPALFKLAMSTNTNPNKIVGQSHVTINSLIQFLPPNNSDLVARSFISLHENLKSVFGRTVQNKAEQACKIELLAQICDSIQVAAETLKTMKIWQMKQNSTFESPNSIGFAHAVLKERGHDLVNVLLNIIQNIENPTVEEEAMLAIGFIASSVGSNFKSFLPKVMPILRLGLSQPNARDLVLFSLLTVMEIVKAVGPHFESYSTGLLQSLKNLYNSKELAMSCRVVIPSLIGELCAVMKNNFVVHFQGDVGNFMFKALEFATKPNRMYETEIIEIRTNLLDGFCEIINTFHNIHRSDLFNENRLVQFTDFLKRLSKDHLTSPNALMAAMAVMTDLVRIYPSTYQMLRTAEIRTLVNQCGNLSNPIAQDLSSKVLKALA